ncbi:MAG: methyltransferase domain-containing protein [Synechococcus sp. SB0662_bin_45]|nr:methyltransferase domain-containing protein [Synechococcus sp. SB0668_bin_13]MYE21505.1 methyltransferase domain-containing protein [Synechococcus sp. SB0662_bin_45]
MPWLLLLVSGVLVLVLYAYLAGKRPYRSPHSVAANYDHWTRDGLLERLWGDHIHLGYYGDPPQPQDFRASKARLVHEMVQWAGLYRLPPGSRVLDVGCGIGGSARILARDYGFDVLGISISSQQIARARALTPAHLPCRFAVMDALAMPMADGCFDAVWTVEAAPHIANKQCFANELLRLLKPGGRLVMADWNQRDPRRQPPSRLEQMVLNILLTQWGHAAFASMEAVQEHLQASPSGCINLHSADWSRATLPAWPEAIREGFRRPWAVLSLGPAAVVQGLREVPTILLMAWAWRRGLLRFGVFCAERAGSGGDGRSIAHRPSR